MMIFRSKGGSTFEFAVMASLRAKQLIRGAVPRVEGNHKPFITAQLEILAGKVRQPEDASTAEPSRRTSE